MHTHDQDDIYHNKLEAGTCYERASTNKGSKLLTSVIYTSSTIEISVQVIYYKILKLMINIQGINFCMFTC
jgi:hypothetical protein